MFFKKDKPTAIIDEYHNPDVPPSKPITDVYGALRREDKELQDYKDTMARMLGTNPCSEILATPKSIRENAGYGVNLSGMVAGHRHKTPIHYTTASGIPPGTYHMTEPSWISTSEAPVKSKLERLEVPLEKYLEAIRGQYIVDSVDVLYDDRPNEISIRIALMDNLDKMGMGGRIDGEEELGDILRRYKPEGAKRTIITYTRRETIE